MMKLFTDAPWQKTLLSEGEFVELSAKLGHKKCWHVKKYLGSMMYFDMGEKLIFTGRNGVASKTGSCTISIRDCSWELFCNDKLIMCSDQISDADSDALQTIFLNSQIMSIDKSEIKKIISIRFNNDHYFLVDIANKYKSSDSILHFVTEDGRIYDVEPKGKLYLADKVSSLRWRADTN